MTRRILNALLVVVVLATGCSDDTDETTDPPPTTSTTTSTTTSSTTTLPPTSTGPYPTEDDLIIAVVERFYEIVVEANNPPILENPIWDEVATPEFANGLRERAIENLENREGLRPADPRVQSILAPELLELDSDHAVLDACVRDDAVLYDLDSGTVLNDAVIFVWTQYSVARHSSQWLVSNANNVESFDGEAACLASY